MYQSLWNQLSRNKTLVFCQAVNLPIFVNFLSRLHAIQYITSTTSMTPIIVYVTYVLNVMQYTYPELSFNQCFFIDGVKIDLETLPVLYVATVFQNM